MNYYFLFSDYMNISESLLASIITKPKITDVIEPNHKELVSGMTVLGNELFVVHYNQSEVDVYSCHDNKYTLCRDIQVDDMERPVDLTSCERYQCVYISDAKLNVIHKINLEN